MRARALTLDDMYKVIGWREKATETLRTPYFLTEKMQSDYYDNVISNRDGKTRYFAFVDGNGTFCGYGGIENIQWESSIGEISIIVDPLFRGKGYGLKIVDLILDIAFNTMNLNTVWGECYTCGASGFWEKIIAKRKAFSVELPARKYYNGKYWNSLYFSFNKEQK